MKQQIEVLGRLVSVRHNKVQQLLAQLNHQRTLCQRYRNNINGLNSLSNRDVNASTALQRDNQLAYRQTLQNIIESQQKELALAEQQLNNIQKQLQSAMCNEKAIGQLLDQKTVLWQDQLKRREQQLQDSMAALSWVRADVG